MTIQAPSSPVLNVLRLPHGQDLDLPAYETSGAAGMDLRAAVTDGEPLTIAPGKRALVPTGLVFEIPAGFEVQIRPRSGLAFKNGITCLNTPGTIDADYRGEVKVLLVNLGQENFVVEPGMRIAQLIFAALPEVSVEVVTELPQSDRGAGGFGSTGRV